MAKQPARSPGHRVHVVVKGAADKRWQALLAGEGGTQQYHALAAFELYCATKGYGPKPPESK